MPAADRPAQIDRHAGGRAAVWSRKRVRRAAASSLLFGTILFVANVISRLLFHRDSSSSGDSLHAFISELISFAIAGLTVGLATACAAGIWTRLRHRLVSDRKAGKPDQE